MSTLAVGTIKSVSSAAPVFQNTSGTEIGQLGKVWALINMSGGSILDSFGVSSISDQGTGTFDVNFTTALTNVNACAVASSSDSTLHTQIVDGNCDANGFRYRCLDGGGSLSDDPFTGFILFDN